jgi:adenylate cyclase
VFTLVAHGGEPLRQTTLTLASDQAGVLGRDAECDLAATWDRRISRRHATVRVAGEVVVVEKTVNAGNPIFFSGHEVDRCEVRAGQAFIIGETTFLVSRDQASTSPGQRPVEQVTFDRRDLLRVRYRDADKRIDVLSHLPEVIRGTRVDDELYLRLTNLVLTGVPNADAVAIVSEESGRMKVLHWQRRQEAAGEFKPSGRLVTEAIRSQQTILHVWQPQGGTHADYTQVADCDWAFCTPIPESSAQSRGLYVAGRLDAMTGAQNRGVYLQGDVKFTEFVAEIISSVQRQTRLERQQAGLRQFFAPPILSALGDDLDTDLLEPRECDVTVLFCDLRGFSKRSEEAADNLIGLLDRVSRALEVMTDQILKFGGVTGDFQGDAALGFWGWPFASGDSALNACRAALGIRQEFARTRSDKDHPLSDFEMGIGVAHGRAVAGKIGTSEQVKVTVFGPVVNLASRLEGMTKQLRVPILLDEATAEIFRSHAAQNDGRLRRLARVLPYGMDNALTVSELLPPEADYSGLTTDQIIQYEQAVDHFIAGDWESAWSLIHGTPASDRAQDFLAMLIAQHNRSAPADWDGVVRLHEK